MDKKITKNLIILGFIFFSFILNNSALAYEVNYAFDRNYNSNYYDNNYMYYPYNNTYDNYNNNENNQPTPIINNYYYQTIPTTRVSQLNSSNTTSTAQKENYNKNQIQEIKKTDSKNNSNTSVYNNLGASAYDSYQKNDNNITALSLRGSGGFMPSSIWQWILVVILILIIIVISRMIKHKSEIKDESHVAHSH